MLTHLWYDLYWWCCIKAYTCSMYLTPFIGMCFPYKWCQGTPVVHSSYPGTDDPLHCMVTAMAEVFRVHLSIISIGVNSKGNLQISCKCFAFMDLLSMLPCHQPLSTYSAVQRQLFNVVVHSCNLCSCTQWPQHASIIHKIHMGLFGRQKIRRQKWFITSFFGMPLTYKKPSLTSNRCAGSPQYPILYTPFQNKCRVAM